MATGLVMNGNSTKPSISFHHQTFGQNIQLEENGSRAIRHTSFDNGITFTSTQIKMDERIHMKIVDIDESGQWLGSLAIGFTNINPDSIQRQDLCKSALPNLCQKAGTSYVKRIFDKLTKQIIITFYYNREGAFYILDGKEQELCKSIDATQPLWGVIDIYGNVKSIIFTIPPQVTDGSRAFFTKYDKKPDKLPIRYFKKLKQADLQPLGFQDIHGPELELFCDNMIVFRKNVQRLSKPYVFMDFPMKPGDEFYVRILSIDSNFRIPGFLGFTNAGPSVFMNNFDKLPSNDLMALYDRPEFWIFNDDAFDEKLSELDEYRFVFDKGGDFHMWRNNESERPTKTVAFADKDQIFYPFFFLNGRITALALMGIVSSTKRTRNPPKKEEKDEDAGLCQICLDSKANCVMIPCGHVFYCSDCRGSCETKFGKTCPTCQKAYENVFEIEDD